MLEPPSGHACHTVFCFYHNTIFNVNMNNIPTSVTMVTKMSRLYSTLAARLFLVFFLPSILISHFRQSQDSFGPCVYICI